MEIPLDYLLESYNYELPEANIAQEPADRRDGSRLLVVDRADGSLTPVDFTDLIDHLPDNALQTDDCEGGRLVWVPNLQEILEACYDQGLLPSELGEVSWARPGRSYKICRYTGKKYAYWKINSDY